MDPTNPAGLSFDTRLLNTYYDAMWCFLNIRTARPVGENAYWEQAKDWARAIYRDQYLLANGGGLPGFWSFGWGLYEDWRQFDNIQSRDALILLSQNGAFAPDATPLANTASQIYSREVAYVLMNYILVERMGYTTRRPKYVGFKDQIIGHMDQWFISKTAAYLRPFMWSLSAATLIEYSIDNPMTLAATISILTIGADYIWDNLWVDAAKSWKYTDRIVDGAYDIDPAPDLNLLIAPIYAWLYYQTGQTRFQTRFDAAFVGGIPVYTAGLYVSGAYLGSAPTAVGVLGKHVCQNSRLIFKGLQWRQATPRPYL